MEDHELAALLLDRESDRVERKSSASRDTLNRVREAIGAFANDFPNHQKPGVVFIGVHDDGTCADLRITDELLLKLADLRSDGNIVPLPMMTVQKRTLAGCELAVIIVEPAYAPPARYRGRVWIRVGPRRAMASASEERHLSEKRRAYDLPFDLRPLPMTTLDDLDTGLFQRTYLPAAVAPEILEENRRPVTQQMMSLRFTTTTPPHIPTVLGLLVIGKTPRQVLPCDYIQFLRIEGKTLTDPIKDQREISGPMPDLLRMLDEILEINISVASDFTTGPQEIQHPDYPLVALQQLARNAVLHRTYEGTHAPVRITWFSDRIEIQNPGGLFGQVTQQNFGQPGIADYRNPHLAEAMKNLGYVQRFGVGIPMARERLTRNGNPPPEFKVGHGHFLVIIRRSQ